jgi:hypothetical protein
MRRADSDQFRLDNAAHGGNRSVRPLYAPQSLATDVDHLHTAVARFGGLVGRRNQ